MIPDGRLSAWTLSARVDRALVTLFPGESATFRIYSDARIDEAGLTARPVLRSANDLVVKR